VCGGGGIGGVVDLNPFQGKWGSEPQSVCDELRDLKDQIEPLSSLERGTRRRSPSPQAGNFAEQDGALCSDSCLYTMKVARRFCLQHGLSWWPAL
jgi:hypothetical protein